MTGIYFNREDVSAYIFYGLMSALLFCIPVWYYLHSGDYEEGWTIYLGSGLFMLIILLYSIKLTRRKQGYKNAWRMIVAGHITVFTGILCSMLFSLLLCAIYIPGFLTSHSAGSFLNNAPLSLNYKNTGTIFQVFVPAIMGNAGVGSFMAIVVPYAKKAAGIKERSMLQQAVE